jgi:AcrR family transcriptional regulator
MTTQTTVRKTADQRREDLLEAALTEFADHGFEGASTDTIARRVGISQPYLFRLFGTKKDLFIAASERCFQDVYKRFDEAAKGLQGEAALCAMGVEYKRMITEDPRRLRGQMQSYAACSDPDIGAAVRRGFGRLVELVQSKGAAPERATSFFAAGMLINVMASMGVLGGEETWAKGLIKALMEDD